MHEETVMEGLMIEGSVGDRGFKVHVTPHFLWKRINSFVHHQASCTYSEIFPFSPKVLRGETLPDSPASAFDSIFFALISLHNKIKKYIMNIFERIKSWIEIVGGQRSCKFS